MKLADRVEENVSFRFFCSASRNVKSISECQIHLGMSNPSQYVKSISECQINPMIAKPTQVDQLQTRLGDWVNNLTNTDSSGVAEVTR